MPGLPDPFPEEQHVRRGVGQRRLASGSRPPLVKQPVLPATEPAQASSSTAERILATALDLFSERGYDGASLREIARRADANIAAVNYHYGSKDRLWRAVCAECTQLVARTVSGSLTFPLLPERVLEQVVGGLFDLCARDDRPVRILFWTWLSAERLDFEGSANTYRQLEMVASSYMEHLREIGHGEDVDLEMVGSLVQAMFAGIVVSQVGHRHWFGRDITDRAHAERVRSQLIKAARLMFVGDRCDKRERGEDDRTGE